MNYKEATDEALALAAGEGCEEAWEELILRLRRFIAGKAAALQGPACEGEDLYQEGLIGALKAVRGFDAEKGVPFRSFAELCITRQMVSALRRARRKKNPPPALSLSEDPVPEPVANPLEEPENQLLLKEALTGIREEGSGRFSALERDVWALYLRGLSYGEIGRTLGRSPASVGNALQRARGKLRACFREP